jgi:hypothetical protein
MSSARIGKMLLQRALGPLSEAIGTKIIDTQYAATILSTTRIVGGAAIEAGVDTLGDARNFFTETPQPIIKKHATLAGNIGAIAKNLHNNTLIGILMPPMLNLIQDERRKEPR